MMSDKEVQLLLQHYKDNTLTSDELERLRTLLQSDRAAFEAVMDDELKASCDAILDEVDRRLLELARRDLHRRISTAPMPELKPRRTALFRRILAYAAALIVPVLLATSLYFAYDAASLSRQSLRVVTRQGERTTLTLPDGSTVALNPLSQVSYQAKDFSRSSRRIDYVGDGAFDIAKQAGAPFIIRTKEVEIRVLGTKFFFSARPDEAAAKVYLEQGIIELTALRSGRTVRLKPLDWAEVDYASGQITLSKHLPNSTVKALKQGDLIFRNEPFRDVVRRLEINYDYNFKLEAPIADHCFTGTLPTDNILEAIRILEVTLDVASDISNREIMFYQRR